MLLKLAALGALGYVGYRYYKHHDGRAAFASGESGRDGAVRSAGPESMRDMSPRDWTKEDQASDESFPASDPPSTY